MQETAGHVAAKFPHQQQPLTSSIIIVHNAHLPPSSMAPMIAPSMPLASLPLPTPQLPFAAVLALGSILLGRTMLLLWSRLTTAPIDAALVELVSKPKAVPHYTAVVENVDIDLEVEDKPEVPPRPSPRPKEKRTERPADVYLTEDDIMAILYTSATFRDTTSVLGYAPDPLLPPLLEVDEE